MRHWKLVVGICLVSWCVAGSAEAAPNPNANPNATSDQDKDFSYNPLDDRGQGNMGQPDMRDPFGFDRDRDRSETGNQGRPFQGTAEEPGDGSSGSGDDTVAEEPGSDTGGDDTVAEEPGDGSSGDDTVAEEPGDGSSGSGDETVVEEPGSDTGGDDTVAEEPPAEDPTPTPVVDLPAPTTIWASWSVTGSTYTNHHRGFDKQFSWYYADDDRIAGFKVYEKDAGDTDFRLYETLTLADLADGWYWYYNGNRELILYVNKANHRFSVIRRRLNVSDWPVGTYHHYVVPVDAAGQAGNASPIVRCTTLQAITMLRPTDNQVIEPLPAFQWTDVGSHVLGDAGHGLQWPQLYDETLHTRIWDPRHAVDATGGLYDGDPLDPANAYSISNLVWILRSLPDYGVSIGSTYEPSDFTVQE